eukprot:6184533-Pleurochrysis_carterae.AAC.1
MRRMQSKTLAKELERKHMAYVYARMCAQANALCRYEFGCWRSGTQHNWICAEDDKCAMPGQKKHACPRLQTSEQLRTRKHARAHPHRHARTHMSTLARTNAVQRSMGWKTGRMKEARERTEK